MSTPDHPMCQHARPDWRLCPHCNGQWGASMDAEPIHKGVCQRCQHRECVCRPPERMLRASEVASVLRRIRDALDDKVGTVRGSRLSPYGVGYDSGLNRAIAEIEDVAKDVLGIDLDKTGTGS